MQFGFLAYVLQKYKYKKKTLEWLSGTKFSVGGIPVEQGSGWPFQLIMQHWQLPDSWILKT